jgi:hypothetical protein
MTRNDLVLVCIADPYNQACKKSTIHRWGRKTCQNKTTIARITKSIYAMLELF